jgi:hypothetical protein
MILTTAPFLTLMLAFPTLQTALGTNILSRISLAYCVNKLPNCYCMNSIRIKLSIRTSGSCFTLDNEISIFMTRGKNTLMPSLQFLMIISNLYLLNLVPTFLRSTCSSSDSSDCLCTHSTQCSPHFGTVLRCPCIHNF